MSDATIFQSHVLNIRLQLTGLTLCPVKHSHIFQVFIKYYNACGQAGGLAGLI
jgi:hypothetical protein